MSATPEPYARRWQALGVLAASLLVITIDNTILNVALPSLRADLDVDSSQAQWIVDSYLLVFAGLLLVGGTLGDRFGRRRALILGLLVFGGGSVLAAFAGSANELIAARALMGVGAAGIMPATLSILMNIFPEEERPKAIAAWAGVSGLGVALGPIAGGLLLEEFSWASVFLVNIPIVIGAIFFAKVLVPESSDPETPRVDVVGAVLSIVGLTAIVWGLIEASEQGWTDPTILGAFAMGGSVLAVFLAWEKRVRQPMIDITIFRNLRFSASSLSIMLVFFGLLGTVFMLTTYLQTVLGYTPLEAGLRMIPVAVGLVVGSRAAITVAEKLGTKVAVAGGLLIVACGMQILSQADMDSGYGLVATALVIMGFGMAVGMGPATEAIMSSLPKEKAGVGSAMNDVLRELGGTLGVAVLGSILASKYGSSIDGSVSTLPEPVAAASQDSVEGAHVVAAQLGGDSATNLIASADQAFVTAMGTTTDIAAAVALAGALVALVFLPARRNRLEEEQEETAEPVEHEEAEPALV
ncbi:MFS transporter [Nocardioides sp. HM23]|uniref:MFS transporter n=1 Tax=Nocardioides bizhenqiangii TaxID=3095076 RepID=UPI002ACA090B|nr:MFS transporter [Nocardioides sp. HM23]MDZ5620072.1 MFS transporter [Nocardioides sp. HM23]